MPHCSIFNYLCQCHIWAGTRRTSGKLHIGKDNGNRLGGAQVLSVH